MLGPAVQGRLLALLFISVLINYMDRGNLGVAAPAILRDLDLTPARMGYLLSAFFWTYATFQVVSGCLIDRWEVSRVYAVGFLVWSLATLGTGLVTGFAGLLLARLVLGVGESAAYPAYSKILSSGFPEHRRGLANALIDLGTKVGPALGTLMGVLIPRFGWRFFFGAIGATSLLWLVPWLVWSPRIQVAARKEAPGPGLLEIASLRAAWATFLGLFCFNYAFYFLLTWLPSYLVMQRGFTMQMMAVYGALPFCATAAASLVCGWLSDRRIAAGVPVDRVRRRFAVAGLLLCSTTLPAATLPSHFAAMLFLVLAFIGIGIFTSNVWAITQTLAGPGAAGRWTGLQNAVGNMGGVVAPIVTGLLVGRLGSFYVAFFAASAMVAAAAVLYGCMLGRIAPVQWRCVPGP